MERTWRWFGKKDKITLAQLKQIGVEGIVTALHDVPLGEVWTREKIHDLKTYIESYGMRWSVVESLPVVETGHAPTCCMRIPTVPPTSISTMPNLLTSIFTS